MKPRSARGSKGGEAMINIKAGIDGGQSLPLGLVLPAWDKEPVARVGVAGAASSKLTGKYRRAILGWNRLVVEGVGKLAAKDTAAVQAVLKKALPVG